MNWWQRFTDSFESKGAQILLLWVTDMIFVGVLVAISIFHVVIDPMVMSTITGLVGGVNGAFLGAMGARQNNGNGTTPDKLAASVVPNTEKR
jgi:hypothetical protein